MMSYILVGTTQVYAPTYSLVFIRPVDSLANVHFVFFFFFVQSG